MRTSRRMRKAAVGSLAAACVVTPLLITETAMASDVTVLNDVNGGRFVVRPSHIAYSSDIVLGRLTWGSKKGYLRWQKWNGRTAKGVGTLWVYCGAECWSSRKARVTLSGVRGGHFTRMSIRARYDGETETRTSIYRLAGTDYGGWYWG